MSNEIEKAEQLKHEVQTLYDMELNNYLMTRAINILNSRIKNLGIPNQYYKPVPKEAHEDKEGKSMQFGCGAFIGGMVGYFLIGLPLALLVDSEAIMFVILFLGMVVGGIVALWLAGKAVDKEQLALDQQYQVVLKEYQNQIENDNMRVTYENEIKKALVQERDQLEAKRKESIDLLELMYNKFGIDKDFRTLVAIGYMNDYIRLGISNQLHGINGLYYLIQQNIRWDILHGDLTNISAKLDTIINNQDRIYFELCSINEKCDHMIDLTVQSINTNLQNGEKLDAITENTATTAYTVERARFENEYRHMTGQ